MRLAFLRRLLRRRESSESLSLLFKMGEVRPALLRPALVAAVQHQQTHRHRRRSASRAGLPMSVH